MQMKRLEIAAETLSPEEGDLAVVRLALQRVGVPAPETTDLSEFIARLIALKFRPVPTCLAEPLPGSLYVECGEDREPIRLGIVAKVRTEEGKRRTAFTRAATTERDVELGRVDFWLLAPSACVPCAQRKRPQMQSQVSTTNPTGSVS